MHMQQLDNYRGNYEVKLQPRSFPSSCSPQLIFIIFEVQVVIQRLGKFDELVILTKIRKLNSRQCFMHRYYYVVMLIFSFVTNLRHNSILSADLCKDKRGEATKSAKGV